MNEASVQLEAMCRVTYFISNLVNWGTALGKFHLHRSRVCWGDHFPSTLFLPTKHDASRLILKNGMPLNPPPPPPTHTPDRGIYILSRIPVTRTLKGTRKQFKLATWLWANGVDCKIQFSTLQIDNYWFFSRSDFVRKGHMIRHHFMAFTIKCYLSFAPIKIKLM